MSIIHADTNAQRRAIQRRRPAARGFEYRKRNPQLADDANDGPPFTGPITEPITFTQVRTLSPIAISTTVTRSSSSTRTSSTSTRTSSSSSSTEVASTSTTTTSTPVSPSASAILPSSGSENAPETSPSVQSTSLGTRALSGGAIAGIAVAVVIVISAIIVFLVRKRMVAHRKGKRANWSPGISPPQPAMTTVPLATPAVEAFRDAYARSASPPPPVPPLPVPQSLTPGGRGSVALPPPTQALPPVPLVAPPPSSYNNPPIVGGTVVRCTFIPNLDDELWITTGETIKVLQEYDDGWALCENAQMQRGMVPVECLDKGAKRDSRPNLSRASSLSNRSK